MNNFRVKSLKILNSKIFQYILYSPMLDFHQWKLLRFVKRCSSGINSHESILDMGAGELRYKKYFDHCNYRSQDLCVGDNVWYFESIDIKSSIYNVPVEPNSFEYVLCTQVLEHLEYPEKAFIEFNRVLKYGGKVFLSAPLGQGEHQVPYDFFRYTKFGLKSLGERYGFRMIYIEPHGGIFINLEYMLWQAIGKLIPFGKSIPVRYFLFFLLLPIKFISGTIFIILDVFDRDKGYTNNYNCIYEKVS